MTAARDAGSSRSSRSIDQILRHSGHGPHSFHGRHCPPHDHDLEIELTQNGPMTNTSCRGQAVAEADFVRSHPAYATTRVIDALRASEYDRLDNGGSTYLDYTGAGVYATSQVNAHLDLLSRIVAGNPHSGNLASQTMTALINRARRRVLEYFRASPNEYEVIFTPNATGALKGVAESYPFAPGGRYLLTADNHNSVNGIREFATRRGADVEYAPIVGPDLRSTRAPWRTFLAKPANGPKLFAYPAQSNFSGVHHTLEWVTEAKRHGWDVIARRGGVRADQSAGPQRVPPGLRDRCRFTRCSAIRPDSARCWRDERHSIGCGGPGSRVAPIR